MIKYLKEKWGIRSTARFWLIFCIFAVTGTSILFIKPHLFDFLGIDDTLHAVVYGVLYVIVIFPTYLIILFLLGALTGQHRFFWEFNKRMFSRIRSLFPG
ncbi:MAG: hypothetical protein Kow00127_22520 [Bacteroidales bacterium]